MFGSAAAREVISRATGLKPASERLLHRLLLSPGCGEYGDAKREKRCEDASHSTALRAKSPVACFISRSLGGVPASSFNTEAAPEQTPLSPVRAKAQRSEEHTSELQSRS